MAQDELERAAVGHVEVAGVDAGQVELEPAAHLLEAPALDAVADLAPTAGTAARVSPADTAPRAANRLEATPAQPPRYGLVVPAALAGVRFIRPTASGPRRWRG